MTIKINKQLDQQPANNKYLNDDLTDSLRKQIPVNANTILLTGVIACICIG